MFHGNAKARFSISFKLATNTFKFWRFLFESYLLTNVKFNIFNHKSRKYFLHWVHKYPKLNFFGAKFKCWKYREYLPWTQLDTNRQTGWFVWFLWWQWRRWHPLVQRHLCKAYSRPCIFRVVDHTWPSGWLARSMRWWFRRRKVARGRLSRLRWLVHRWPMGNGYVGMVPKSKVKKIQSLNIIFKNNLLR